MTHPKSFQRFQATGALLLLTSSLMLASCAASDPQPSEPSDDAAQIEVPTAPAPEEAPPTLAEPAYTTLPASVETAVLQDIATSESVAVEDLKIESAEAKSWPDGCLGLGGPDEICTFALVEGWEVTVTQANNRWVYRTDAEGLVVRQADEEA